MQQTSKYQFNLVEGSDDFSPTSLNQNMEKVEEQFGVVAEALAALEGAYVIGSYTGNAPASGTDPGQLIELGFQPNFLIITRGWASNISSSYFLVIGKARINAQDLVFEWKENGFLVKDTNTSGPLRLNTADSVYDYIAFR